MVKRTLPRSGDVGTTWLREPIPRYQDCSTCIWLREPVLRSQDYGFKRRPLRLEDVRII